MRGNFFPLHKIGTQYVTALATYGPAILLMNSPSDSGIMDCTRPIINDGIASSINVLEMPLYKIMSRLSLVLVFKKGILMRIRLSASSNNHTLGVPDIELPTEQQKQSFGFSCLMEDQ